MFASSSESSLNDDEKKYKIWFDFADRDRNAFLSDGEATAIFHMSGLSNKQVTDVVTLTMANHKFKGSWSFDEFVIAMRLISMSKEGTNVDEGALREATLGDGKTKTLEMPDLDILIEAHVQKEEQKKADEEKSKENEVVNSENSPVITPKKSHLLRVLTPISFNLDGSASKNKSKSVLAPTTSVIDRLIQLYENKLKPLEIAFGFNEFESLEMTTAEFKAKPMVLVLGQTSGGKTTFICNLIQEQYEDARIGEEATTDKFYVLMGKANPETHTGTNAVQMPDLPFANLAAYGDSFLERFDVVEMKNPNLSDITFVDTPGIRNGQRLFPDSSYDFVGITKWFVERSHLVILVFDSRTNDFCVEFEEVVASLRKHSQKVCVVLNKVDQVEPIDLLTTYGSLQYGLGRLLHRPQAPAVYFCTLNGEPIDEKVGDVYKKHFEGDKKKLMSRIRGVSSKSLSRKVHEFSRRAQSSITHARIMIEIKRLLPVVLKNSSMAKESVLSQLESVFEKVQEKYKLPVGDLPDMRHYKKILKSYNLNQLRHVDVAMIDVVLDMLKYDMPQVQNMLRNTSHE